MIKFLGGKLVPLVASFGNVEHLLDNWPEYRSLPRSSGIPCKTPSSWPARYVALHLDDGDPRQMLGMLDEWESKRANRLEITEWWRERLEQRLAGE